MIRHGFHLSPKNFTKNNPENQGEKGPFDKKRIVFPSTLFSAGLCYIVFRILVRYHWIYTSHHSTFDLEVVPWIDIVKMKPWSGVSLLMWNRTPPEPSEKKTHQKDPLLQQNGRDFMDIHQDQKMKHELHARSRKSTQFPFVYHGVMSGGNVCH